jgi:hypothetical protein
LHPRGPAYCWQSHLRALCALARDLLEHPEKAGIPWSLISGTAEEMHIRSLAAVPIEVLILELIGEQAVRPGFKDDVLWWLDPHDTHLRPVATEPARTGQPGSDTYI